MTCNYMDGWKTCASTAIKKSSLGRPLGSKETKPVQKMKADLLN